MTLLHKPQGFSKYRGISRFSAVRPCSLFLGAEAQEAVSAFASGSAQPPTRTHRTGFGEEKELREDRPQTLRRPPHGLTIWEGL